MKEFAKGLLKLIGATLVSCFILPIGIIYSIIHASYMTLSLKKWYMFFVLVWRNIDGTFAAVGHLLGEIGYAQDLLWNVNGEMFEDLLTTNEETTFGLKNITVSSSVGKLEVDNKIIKGRQWFSNLLNIAFQQKQHAKDSWLFDEAKNKLKSDYFN